MNLFFSIIGTGSGVVYHFFPNSGNTNCELFYITSRSEGAPSGQSNKVRKINHRVNREINSKAKKYGTLCISSLPDDRHLLRSVTPAAYARRDKIDPGRNKIVVFVLSVPE